VVQWLDVRQCLRLVAFAYGLLSWADAEMKCTHCDRPLLVAAVTITKHGKPAHYGPVCARRQFPELYSKRKRKAKASETIEDDRQLELSLG